jgi:predicted dehydrogenase
MGKYDRKDFIKTSGSVVAAAALAPGLAFGSQKQNAKTLSVGLIGSRNMGYWMLVHALNQTDVVCGGLCDVDKSVLERRAGDVEEMTGKRPELYTDYREMLKNESIDAVIVGTPDHWHCKIAVDAMAAGKHVYVEKPMARTIAECAVMVEAAEKYGTVVQVGQQQRSRAHWSEVVEMVQSGKMGKIRTIKCWGNFGYGLGPEKRADAPVPEGVDYEMWLGPSPKRPFNPSRFHGSWRFFYDYGGGLITDWGAHLLDIPIWAMGIDGPPKSVSSIGGVFSGQNRDLDMADTQTVIYEFDDFNMTWEHAGGLGVGPYDRHYGVAFVGNKGTVVVNRQGWEIYPEMQDETPLIEPEKFIWESGDEGHFDHMKNFINAIRNGEALNCPVEAGYQAAFYGHIGNLAYQTNSKLEWDEDGNLKDAASYESLIKPKYRTPWEFPEI